MVEPQRCAAYYRMLVVAASITGALLSGCTMIDMNRTVPGWPEMRTTVTKVTRQEAAEHCRKTQADRCSGTSGMLTISSCYQWNFDLLQDWIWYGDDADLEHEWEHHLGHPHVGEGKITIMQCYLDEWKEKREGERRNREHG